MDATREIRAGNLWQARRYIPAATRFLKLKLIWYVFNKQGYCYPVTIKRNAELIAVRANWE